MAYSTIGACLHEYIARLRTRVSSNRFTVIHLELSDFDSAGEFYTIGILDGDIKRILFADEENVTLANKSRPSLTFGDISSLEDIWKRLLNNETYPASLEDIAWMALTEKTQLRVCLSNPAATADWPRDEEIAARALDMDFE